MDVFSSDMPRTLLTGATGTLGTALRSRLRSAGHDVRAASRSPPDTSEESVKWISIDIRDSAGLETALEDVDLVIHAATAPLGETEAVDVTGTDRLLEAAVSADVDQFCYPSIVGIDEIPYSYYEHKVAAERRVEASPVPSTIVRATQFHSFIAETLGYVARLPVWPLPTKMKIQPIDVGEVADQIVEYTATGPSGRTDPIGGPEIKTLGEIARAYRKARGKRRPIIRLPLPSDIVAAFQEGHATCPAYTQGTISWESWLADQYGPQ